MVVPVGMWAARRVVQALWSACCPQRAMSTGFLVRRSATLSTFQRSSVSHADPHRQRHQRAQIKRRSTCATMKPTPPTGRRLVPPPSSRLVDATAELPRVFVLTQSRAHTLIPRQDISARRRHCTKQDVPPQRLQVAKQLLALIPSPHRSVLRTAPRAANLPTAVELTSAAATSTHTVGSPEPTTQRFNGAMHRLSATHAPPPSSASQTGDVCLRSASDADRGHSKCPVSTGRTVSPPVLGPSGECPVLTGHVGDSRRCVRNGPAWTRTRDQPIMSRRL